jgi:hypothetical protein
MRKSIVAVLLTLVVFSGYSQSDTSYWKTNFTGTMNFNQAAFSNWAAGGANNMALNGLARFRADYNKDKTKWRNEINAAYGFSNQAEQGWRKTDDLLSFNSNFGHMVSQDSGRTYISAELEFKTQFTDGYDYPNDSIRISRFMSPGYININTGIEYNPYPFLRLLFSPLNAKITIVNDDSLSAQGAFGVDPGSTSRFELGLYGRVLLAKEDIVTNVDLESKLEIFSNYVFETFQHYDVNWQTIALFNVNKVLSASVIFHLIYDDDITFSVLDENDLEVGRSPKVQLKEVLGLGLTVKL